MDLTFFIFHFIFIILNLELGFSTISQTVTNHSYTIICYIEEYKIF